MSSVITFCAGRWIVESRSAAREKSRDRRLRKWAASSGIDLSVLDSGQRWVLYAALTFLTFVRRLAPFQRFVAYWLSHCGLGLSSKIVGAVVGTTDRAVRKGRRFSPRKFWERQRRARRGHPPPKLRREQVGPVAKYLAEHKRCSVAELLGFIHDTFSVAMDRLTLRRFLNRYGLGCLREEAVEDAPFLRVALPMVAPSRCSRTRSTSTEPPSLASQGSVQRRADAWSSRSSSRLSSGFNASFISTPSVTSGSLG
jgi:hypothetical protein